VLYLSSTANDISKEHKRSKVTAEDVFSALKELGFENYEEQLRDFLKNYNTEKEDVAKKVQVQKRMQPEDTIMRENPEAAKRSKI